MYVPPTGSEERGVLGVGNIPVARLPSCQDMKTVALQIQGINMNIDRGPMGLGQYDDRGEYCGPHTVSSLLLIYYYSIICLSNILVRKGLITLILRFLIISVMLNPNDVTHSQSSCVQPFPQSSVRTFLHPLFFLPSLTAQGCADPTLAVEYHVTRLGKVVEIKCTTSGETWRLVCTGNAWNGAVGNCTKGTSLRVDKGMGRSATVPKVRL